MKVQCPGCGARYRLDTTRVRRDSLRIKCSKCNNVFTLPVPEAGGVSPNSTPASSASPPAVSSRPKILVVDDARFFRELILDILGSLPCILLAAADGNEALHIIRRERPSLVILDLNLPGLDGFGLLHAVRSDPVLKGTRMLAMSGVFRQEMDITKATEAGADEFLPKSFRPEQLVERVQRLLARGGA